MAGMMAAHRSALKSEAYPSLEQWFMHLEHLFWELCVILMHCSDFTGHTLSATFSTQLTSINKNSAAGKLATNENKRKTHAARG